MHRKAQIKSQGTVGISKDKKLSICIFCKSENTVKNGFRQTENRGKIQRHICKDCKRSFCVNDGFYRMRNKDTIISMAIDMYLSNLSSRKMRNQLARHFDYYISHVSILDWVRRYVLKVHKLVNDLKPKNLSGKFYSDETNIDCEKRDDWFWCNVDWDTRFISGFHYTITKTVEDAMDFIKKAIKHKLPKFIQTDGGSFYPKAMKRLFYSNFVRGKGWHGKLTVEHRINNVYKTKKHNVRIETVFMKIKDRVYDFRGLKAIWSAPILLAGIVLQHNFIEAHTTTGEIPSELAGIKLNLGQNRWLGLIRLASL